MRKLLFASLFVAICILVLLPITEAVRRPQSPTAQAAKARRPELKTRLPPEETSPADHQRRW